MPELWPPHGWCSTYQAGCRTCRGRAVPSCDPNSRAAVPLPDAACASRPFSLEPAAVQTAVAGLGRPAARRSAAAYQPGRGRRPARLAQTLGPVSPDTLLGWLRGSSRQQHRRPKSSLSIESGLARTANLRRQVVDPRARPGRRPAPDRQTRRSRPGCARIPTWWYTRAIAPSACADDAFRVHPERSSSPTSWRLLRNVGDALRHAVVPQCRHRRIEQRGRRGTRHRAGPRTPHTPAGAAAHGPGTPPNRASGHGGRRSTTTGIRFRRAARRRSPDLPWHSAHR